jgi:hypothetical protein
MLVWYVAVVAKIGAVEAWTERQDHRRNCAVCKSRMEYFRKMMEK